MPKLLNFAHSKGKKRCALKDHGEVRLSLQGGGNVHRRPPKLRGVLDQGSYDGAIISISTRRKVRSMMVFVRRVMHVPRLRQCMVPSEVYALSSMYSITLVS